MMRNEAGFAPRVWICSAGYGLVRAASSLSPYSATFATNKPDSVVRSVNADAIDATRQLWWKLIGQWKGPEPGQPRSLKELVRRYPKDPFVIAGSGDYLRALRNDLNEARSIHRMPNKFILVSAGLRQFGDLTKHLLPCDVRLRKRLKGSCHSLNARIVRDLLQNSERWPLDMAVLQPQYLRKLSRLTAFVPHGRRPLTDNQVFAAIRAAMRTDPSATHSALLRHLRNSGRACEQKRFAAIFHEVQEVRRAKR